MPKTKETLVTAFALFSLFFGAGNLILPPLLGFKAGNLWWLVALGFCISAVLIPIMGILAHAKLQGTISDFGKKVSPSFSLIYSFLIYIISINLPSPRTASVTHEIAIAPFFDTPALYTSIVYFLLVLIFVLNRSKILNIIGKILTPAILLILLSIIVITLFSFEIDFGATAFKNPFSEGIIEGYQTFDAIGAVVVGSVIIVSINLKKKDASYADKKRLIVRAGWLAGLGLFLVYTGLILTGALHHSNFETDISRTALLNGISLNTLGNSGNMFLSVLVSLACFTTAVGIVTGTSDYVQHLYKGNKMAYKITAIVGCFLGILMGQFNVAYIISVAEPVLMFIYPVTIVLILLNVIPNHFSTPAIFKAIVVITMLFSIPDFLKSIGYTEQIAFLDDYIPLNSKSMGWVLPALLAFLLLNFKTFTTKALLKK